MRGWCLASVLACLAGCSSSEPTAATSAVRTCDNPAACASNQLCVLGGGAAPGVCITKCPHPGADIARDSDVCGVGAVCVGSPGITDGMCLARCTSASTCAAPPRSVTVTCGEMVSSGPSVCLYQGTGSTPDAG